ncbi:MAG: histidine phosphatase family protein [Rothia sp. (in: high G+C Gram-positive bacteria)]|nr:histidine phosphatase family protein [Rothia sp. (in: high G+C Gram-positive bacteria)]
MNTSEPDLSGSLMLIRHGQTDWNKQHLMQGTSDIPLNDLGRQQAHETGNKLREQGLSFDVLVSSPLSRAFETAQIIGEELGLSVSRTYDDLIERAYGEAEGLDIPAEERKEPDAYYDGVESERALYVRGVKILREITHDYPGQRVLAVSHGSLIRRVLSAAHGKEWATAVPNAEALDIPLPGLFDWVEEREPLLQGKK